jgi:nicotinate-nucleotide pyrophosphorylase
VDEPLIDQWDMVEDIVERALAQDVASGDVTTDAIIPPGLEAEAHILVKEDGVLAGLEAGRRPVEKGRYRGADEGQGGEHSEGGAHRAQFPVPPQRYRH